MVGLAGGDEQQPAGGRHPAHPAGRIEDARAATGRQQHAAVVDRQSQPSRHRGRPAPHRVPHARDPVTGSTVGRPQHCQIADAVGDGEPAGDHERRNLR